MKYDVFISFKNSGKDGVATSDAAEARRLYAALKARGISTFFSEESLAETGRGQFSKAIEAALDSASVLVLVASCREHIVSQWVEAEWDSFLQDVRSGNKQGEMYILNCGGMKPGDLPLFLRRQQMLPPDQLDKLLKFVVAAVPSRKTLDDHVKVALHCFNPDKNEDKVYLVTVHPGGADGRFHVTAHWGARTAKRLSSQMKAANVEAKAVESEVLKARAEKSRGGYVDAPLHRTLSAEARAHLCAALGVSDDGPPGEVRVDSLVKPLPRARTDAVSDGKSQVARKVAPASPAATKAKGRAAEHDPKAGRQAAPQKRSLGGAAKKVVAKKVATKKAAPKKVAAKAQVRSRGEPVPGAKTAPQAKPSPARSAKTVVAKKAPAKAVKGRVRNGAAARR